MNGKILAHLQSRPISPIVNASKETDDVRALKMICVIDHHLEINGAYPELRAMPKLMGELLNLHSFGSFKYYKYHLPKLTFDYKILQCKRCELIGPYQTVIEHMVICHNLHLTPSTCMWCEKVDVQQHIYDSTLEQCYQAYVPRFSSISHPPIIKKVYKVLEKLATTLNVRTIRRENFKNSHKVKEFDIIPPVDQSDDIDHHIIVFRASKRAHKGPADDALEKLFRNAIQHFYGSAVNELFFVQDNNDMPPPPKRPSLDNVKHSADLIAPIQISTAQAPPQSIPQIAQVYSMQPIPMIENQTKSPIGDDFAFMNLMLSVLENINDAQLKHQAKLEIQRITFEYSAQDVMKQINGNNPQ